MSGIRLHRSNRCSCTKRVWTPGQTHVHLLNRPVAEVHESGTEDLRAKPALHSFTQQSSPATADSIQLSLDPFLQVLGKSRPLPPAPRACQSTAVSFPEFLSLAFYLLHLIRNARHLCAFIFHSKCTAKESGFSKATLVYLRPLHPNPLTACQVGAQ